MAEKKLSDAALRKRIRELKAELALLEAEQSKRSTPGAPRPRDEVFDALRGAFDNLEAEGKTRHVEANIIGEAKKAVHASKRDPIFIARLTCFLAMNAKVKLDSCSVQERSSLFKSVRVIAMTGADAREIARRLTNATASGERFPVRALAARWSEYESATPLRPRNDSAKQRSAAAATRVIQDVEAGLSPQEAAMAALRRAKSGGASAEEGSTITVKAMQRMTKELPSVGTNTN